MSKAPFIECLSEDPVVRALAERAVRLLNDTGLDPTKRRVKLQKVQQELLSHQAGLAEIVEKKRRLGLQDQADRTSQSSNIAKTLPVGARVSAQQLAAMRRDCNRAVQEPASAESALPEIPAKVALGLVKTPPEASKRGSRTLHLSKVLHTKLAA